MTDPATSPPDVLLSSRTRRKPNEYHALRNDLRDLNVHQLDEIIAAAKMQLCTRRRSITHVQLMLQAAVVLSGYEWPELLPEFAAPPQETSVPEDDAVVPSCPAQSSPESRIVQVLSELGVRQARVAAPVTCIQSSLAMQDDWGEFYAGLEKAIRRGWIYFLGRDHVCLTEEGVASLS